MLTALIEYINLLYKIIFFKQGFIVCASDTYHLPIKKQVMHENCGINIRKLLNLSEHNLSIIGEAFEQCSIEKFEHNRRVSRNSAQLRLALFYPFLFTMHALLIPITTAICSITYTNLIALQNHTLNSNAE